MSADGTTIFQPRRGRVLTVGTICLVFGLLVAWGAALNVVHLHRAGMAAPPQNGPITTATFLIFIGMFCLLVVIRGVPRLEIDRTGLVLRSLFRAKAVRWEDLGPISLPAAASSRRRRMYWARAVMRDPKGGRKQKLFSIPNSFVVPLDSIVQEMESRRAAVSVNPWAALPAVPPDRPMGVVGFRAPWLTMLMLAGFIGVFVLEQRLGIGPEGPGQAQNIRTLVGLGGLSRNLVSAGQWWRLFTAPWLHANMAHLMMNSVAFALAGWALERLLGRVWMFVIFAVGALAGSGMSLAMAAPTTVSVGASGGIMAMLVALFIVSFRMPAGRAKTQIQVQAARVVIPSMIPVAHGAAALHVDYGAHFGGVLLGGVLGVLLLRSWGERSHLPGYRVSAAVLAGVMMLLFATGGVAVARWYPGFAVVAGMR